jgi:hypothetical protein
MLLSYGYRERECRNKNGQKTGRNLKNVLDGNVVAMEEENFNVRQLMEYENGEHKKMAGGQKKRASSSPWSAN